MLNVSSFPTAECGRFSSSRAVLTAVRVVKTLLARAAPARKNFSHAQSLGVLRLSSSRASGAAFFAGLFFDLAKSSCISSIPEDDDAS
jgi:hypothetical protein